MLSVIFPKPFYTSINRWKIFSLFYGFLKSNGTGGYDWVPDNPADFSILKGLYSINSNGREYDRRLYNFTKFWLSRLYYEFWVAPFIFSNNTIPNLFVYDPITNNNFKGSGLSEKDWIKRQLDNLLKN
jgi:hypothetical protein